MSIRNTRRDHDSLPIPLARGWLAAVCAVGLVSALDASVAHADAGSVELRNGGRVRGEIVAVVPLDRVVVLVEGAGSMTIAWSDVDSVVDGERNYDAGGHVSTRSTPSATEASVAPSVAAPSATTRPATASSALVPARMPASFTPPGPNEMRAGVELLSSLPGRGGAVTLTTVGSLLFAQGIILTGFAGAVSTFSCFDCGGASVGRGFLMAGTLSIGLGAFLIGRGIRKLRVRSRGLESLRARGFFVAELGGSRTLGLDATITADRIVPRLEVRF